MHVHEHVHVYEYMLPARSRQPLSWSRVYTVYCVVYRMRRSGKVILSVFEFVAWYRISCVLYGSPVIAYAQFVHGSCAAIV